MKLIFKTIFLSLILIPLTMFGQSDAPNDMDANGKKHGKWMIYLDANWKQIDDKTKAAYVRYNHFDHGVSLYPMGPSGKKGYRLITVDNQKVGTKTLNGTYKWINKKESTSSVHVFKNGEYVSCKEYFPSGELNQHFDYTKKWKDQEHSWHLTIYDKDGKAVYNFDFHQSQDGTWPKTRG